jgi:O-methyltransferase involved in polyketide biosynthesis
MEAWMASDGLKEVQARFPAYQIWREGTPDRVRYVARGRSLQLSPHAIVTADLDELQNRLLSAGGCGDHMADPVAADQPNIARMYSFWLRGKDHLAVDRSAASKVLELYPEVAEIVCANRAFLARVVRYLAERGITQFIDLGFGFPASPNVHEIARFTTPDARVVYVDRDPVVLAHARALLATDDKVGVVGGDVRDPQGLLADPVLTTVIDRTMPTGVLLVSVLHFLAPAEADASVVAFREWMPPGSYLVISAGTTTGTDPRLIRALQDAYGDSASVHGRAADEIAAWFDGLTFVRPGLVDVWAWPTVTLHRPLSSRARILAGVGRKDADRLAWAP